MNKKSIILCIAMMILPLLAKAEKVWNNGVYYEININDRTAEVIQAGTKYTGHITISTIITYNATDYTVIGIGEKAFYNCSGVTSIIIPSSITYIKENAFYNCSGLTGVHISDIAKWCNIDFHTNTDNPLYYAKKLYLNGILVEDMIIPAEAEKIEFAAFFNCTCLKSVKIENGIKNIVGFTFMNCSSLESIIIPNSITNIGVATFANCSNLTSIDIPDSITNIAQNTFQNCTNLVSIEIPKNIKQIGWGAFLGCNKLSDVYCLAKEIPSIDSEAFKSSNFKSARLYVSSSSIELYRGISPWNQFRTIMELPKYTISYIIDDKVHKTETIEYGTTIIVPETPEKDGYMFCGWSEIPNTMPAHDVVVMGSFIANGYTLTYIVDGKEYKSIIYESGSTITAEIEPIKEGYTFNGWSNIPETMPANDVTVTGSFSINSYKVVYMVDGNIYHTDSVVYNTNIYTAEEPTKKGYTFSGWSEVPEIMPAMDLTITGVFSINNYKITYVVDGKVHYADSLQYGSTINLLTEPTKKGYTFSGWSEIPETMPANDVTVTGTFTVCKYKVTYIVDGEVHSTDSVAYSASINAPEYPTKEGYTFGGWNGIPETMPSEDIIITGTFTPNGYLLNYVLDGDIYKTIVYKYGDNIVPETEPSKEGHTFSGWSEVPETMPANDVTVAGSFTINTYQLTYTLDGAVYYTDSIIYAASISPLAEPAKEGYTFGGWSEIPATMPAEDVTISGEFILNRTQNDAQGLVYELSANGEAYEVANYTSVLVDNLVIPSELYGMPVRTLRDRALMGADELKSIVIPESVTTVGDRTFYSCHELLIIEWNAKAAVNAACFDKPEQYGNMLVFVADASTEVSYQGNVIVGGVADEIVLMDGLPLRNPREFTARHITFTHNFSKKSKIGVSGGWESMVLPFDVQRVVSEAKGELKPFGEADFDTSLPYWLGELQEDGTFAATQHIVANKPFIMQLPNSDEYEDIYNVEGKVTFSAEEVTVHATTDVEQEMGVGYSLLGSYEGTESDNYIYALNDEEYAAGGETYMPGGAFVVGSRDIRPFEAYIYSASANRAPYLRIGGCDTGMEDLVTDKDEVWHTLQGIRLSGRPTERGIYIRNGKKVMVK